MSDGPKVTIMKGDCRTITAGMPEKSIHCTVTSPPYWGMRKYAGQQDTVWGGDPDCKHKWGDPVQKRGTGVGGSKKQRSNKGANHDGSTSRFCERCGAWMGSLGGEPTPDIYVRNLVEIFRGVRRILRDDGCLWLNLGDCYANSKGVGQKGGKDGYAHRGLHGENTPDRSGWKDSEWGLKSGDLMLMPQRVAMAMQADGWWLRSAIVWAKGSSFCGWSGNPMPESVRNRPSAAYEMLFLMTKSRRYFYDWLVAREQATSSEEEYLKVAEARRNLIRYGKGYKVGAERHEGETSFTGVFDGMRNLRNVWAIPTHGFGGSHFATYPEELVRPCITAGTSPFTCQECGAPWEREVERSMAYLKQDINGNRAKAKKKNVDRGDQGGPCDQIIMARQTGWRPTCDHPLGEPGRSIVFDPFGGSGTTGVVAMKMGRDAILAELSDDYVRMAGRRIAKVERRLSYRLVKDNRR
jgi:DNA modification methylase